MNSEPKSEYLLLFRGTDWSRGLSPEETQKVMNQWKNWFDGLVNAGGGASGRLHERLHGLA